MRLLTKALILLGFIIPMQVYALGLGELHTRSALNQPFDARLDLHANSPSELSGLEVKLASPADFARAGIDRPPVLDALRFRVVRDQGNAYVHITSRQPILEPYLNFLIEVNWSRGRLLRELTVLLDPPELLGGEAAGVESPQATQTPSRPKATPPVRNSRPQTAKRRAEAKEKTFPMVYGPIQRNEKLWNIAEKMRGDADIRATIPQVMMALLRNNPEAFIDDNVNQVKSGFVLRIDDTSQINAMSAEQARREFRRQYQLWLDYKQRRAAAARERMSHRSGARQGQSQRQSTSSRAARDKQGVLTLERPKGEKPVGGHLESESVGQGQESEELKKLRKQLAEAQQSAEANQQQNEAMHERLKAMEDQIAALQRLMSVRSDELSSLQQKMDSDKTEAEKQSDEKAAGKAEPGFFTKLSEGMSGFLKALRQSPQTMGIIGGAVLLLLTTLWLLMRRRRQGSADPYLYGRSPAPAYDTGMDEPWGEPEAPLDEVPTPSDTTLPWEAEPELETEPAAPAKPVMEEDPITQADIFIAYGNLDSAIEVMENAVRDYPSNGEYQRKLVDLLQKRDQQAKPEASTAPQQDSGEELLDTQVEQAASGLDMVQEDEGDLLTSDDLMAFEEALNEGDFAAPEDTRTDTPKGHDDIHSALSDFGLELGEDDDYSHEATADKGRTAGRDSGGLDFDLSDIHSELEQLTVDEGHVSASEHESVIPEFDLNASDDGDEVGLDFESVLDDETDTADKPTPEISLDENEADTLEFNLDDLARDLSDEELVSPQDPSTETPVTTDEPAPPVEPSSPDLESFEDDATIDLDMDLDLGEEEDELLGSEDNFDLNSLVEVADHEPDLLNDVDEVGTKLDLARAYIDMGDPEGARAILEEVLNEGSPQQVQEATGLLEQTQ